MMRPVPGVPGPIVIFDGMCDLCSGAVMFVLGRERDHVIRFAALQSEAGQRQLRRSGVSGADGGTLYLIDHDGIHVRSDAVLGLARHLRWPWRAALAFRFVPRKFRDGLYDFVASRRRGWFGAREHCFAPPDDLATRFLKEEP